jgi:type 1 glutamine amidotransferase
MSQDRAAPLQIFVAVKGHAFGRDAFEAMIRGLGGMEPTMVDQPAAAMLLNPDSMRRFDAILFYDMPGLDFRAPRDVRPAAVPPEEDFVKGFEALLAEGKGIVALHHALAGWPGWPAYAEALGGTFLYKDREVRGEQRPSSGYAGDIAYEAVRSDIDHPVLAGLPSSFELTDELYLHDVFEADVVPLLRLKQRPPPDRFTSAMRAVRRLGEGEGEAWQPPAGSDVIAWAKAAGNSPLVYFQPGDGVQTYADPNYRLLLGNALRWVASEAGRDWARSEHRRAG